MEYKINDKDKLLFDELLLSGSEELLKEARRRLSFCGYDDKMIDEILDYEFIILDRTKRKYDKYLYQYKWWLGLNGSKKLLPGDIDIYAMFYKGEISYNALNFSELVAIYDEADF